MQIVGDTAAGWEVTSMSWGGAPPWVYKQNEAIISSSYQSEVARLSARIQELEAENAKLKTELDAMRKNYIAILSHHIGWKEKEK